MIQGPPAEVKTLKHKNWVKISHWVVTASFMALLFSGFVIFMCHPRLYWGEVGNALTPAILELPVSKNYKHGGWEKSVAFFPGTSNAAISSIRTFEIYNQNGWGRSLHFLVAWVLVFTGLVYMLAAIFTGHLKKNLAPTSQELTAPVIRKDVVNHLKMRIPPATKGPQYGLLQKSTYLFVIFFLMPVIVMTGLTMSPAITAAYPFLTTMFFGAQSARTIHFFASGLLVLFVIIHVVMVIRSGFIKQMKAMI
ncbi:cytochrome b/b6 domain-containing protein [Flavitalea sp.]|nr:cytochrome b/b6 domain-containing protein [Flavitalea sp.]